MEERPRPTRTVEVHRCPSCGFAPGLLEDSGEPHPAATHCVICDCPLFQPEPEPIATAESGLESAWLAWLEARRIERWIWFVFMIGLALAATIGLIRGG